jgi:hypothetical protein
MFKKRHHVLVSVLMVVLEAAMLAWPSVTGKEQSITTRRGREMSVELVLDGLSDASVAGLTGQMNFDAKLFSNPRIASDPFRGRSTNYSVHLRDGLPIVWTLGRLFVEFPAARSSRSACETVVGSPRASSRA